MDVQAEPAHQVNGAVGDYHEQESHENGSVRSGGLEGSAGSDTDMSKAEAAGDGKDVEGGDPIPRYTVKKTSSFKPVSVTKSFLMKAGSTGGPKAGSDKGLVKSSVLQEGAMADRRYRHILTELAQPRLNAAGVASPPGCQKC